MDFSLRSVIFRTIVTRHSLHQCVPRFSFVERSFNRNVRQFVVAPLRISAKRDRSKKRKEDLASAKEKQVTTNTDDDRIVPPLFILAGEANMSGRCIADTLPPTYVTKIKGEKRARVNSSYEDIEFQYCWSIESNRIRGGTSSMDEWLPIKPPPNNNPYVGPEFAIAQNLAKRMNPDVAEVYFLKYTLLEPTMRTSWNPYNKKQFGHPSLVGHFERFIEFCNRHIPQDGTDSAQKETPGRPRYKLAGMFWLHGETDSKNLEDAECYLQHFRSFVEKTRLRLDAPDLPVVASPIASNADHVATVNRQLHEAGSGAVENCYCIDNLPEQFGVETRGQYKHHFSVEGICDVGRRMGEIMPLADEYLRPMVQIESEPTPTTS